MPPKGKGADAETIAAAQALADSGKPDGEDNAEQIALQESALERLENTINEADLDTKSLVADVTGTILELFKRRPKPWSASSPQEQRDVAKVAGFAAKELVNRVVSLVAANNRPAIRAVLDGITVSDKVTGKFKLASMPEDQMAEILSELYHANRKMILIITADSGQYEETDREHVETENPELPFAGDIGDPDDADADADAENGDNDHDDDQGEVAETIN